MLNTMTNIKRYFEPRHQKVNLLQINIKILSICGIIPNENINASLWKSILFRMFQIQSFLLYMFIAILQLAGLYCYWGDLSLITECIGVIFGYAVAYMCAAYFIFYGKNVSKLIEAFETNSIYTIEFIRLNPKHMKIISDTRNYTLLLSKSASLVIIVAGIMYILPTFIHHLSASDKQILEEIETAEGLTKYFVVVMWLPPIVKQTYAIRVTFVLQALCTFAAFLYVAAFIPFSFILMFYVATQFKLISSVLREMDELIRTLHNSNTIVDNISEQMNSPDDTLLPEYISVTKCELDTLERKPPAREQRLSKKLNGKSFKNLLQVHDINLSSGKPNDLPSAELAPVEANDAASSYLLECIKLHQACIQ